MARWNGWPHDGETHSPELRVSQGTTSKTERSRTERSMFLGAGVSRSDMSWLSRKSSGALETGTGSAAKRRCLSCTVENLGGVRRKGRARLRQHREFPGTRGAYARPLAQIPRFSTEHACPRFQGGAGEEGGQAPLEDSRSQSPFLRPRSLLGQTLTQWQDVTRHRTNPMARCDAPERTQWQDVTPPNEPNGKM